MSNTLFDVMDDVTYYYIFICVTTYLKDQQFDLLLLITLRSTTGNLFIVVLSLIIHLIIQWVITK